MMAESFLVKHAASTARIVATLEDGVTLSGIDLMRSLMRLWGPIIEAHDQIAFDVAQLRREAEREAALRMDSKDNDSD
jgi:hypothetical protein